MIPRAPLAVLVAMLAGFVANEPLGVDPVWVAAAAPVVLSVRGVATRRVTIPQVIRSANTDFCAFVVALGVVVAAVQAGGIGRVLRAVLPSGDSLPSLLAVAVIAAVLANLVNNVPAALLLLPVAAAGGTGPVLATLIGVNIGPNATFAGSLATLLWRRSLGDRGHPPSWREFLALGVYSTPIAVVVAVLALWARLAVLGR